MLRFRRRRRSSGWFLSETLTILSLLRASVCERQVKANPRKHKSDVQLVIDVHCHLRALYLTSALSQLNITNSIIAPTTSSRELIAVK